MASNDLITIEIQDREVMDYLTRLSQRLDDLTPVMDAIGMRMEEQVSGRFETETDPSGSAWAPWAERTRKTYPKDGHRNILDRYGDMLGSLNHQAGPDWVRVGFSQDYAAYHEYGTKRMTRRGLLTANPTSGNLGADDRAAILDILQGYLDQ